MTIQKMCHKDAPHIRWNIFVACLHQALKWICGILGLIHAKSHCSGECRDLAWGSSRDPGYSYPSPNQRDWVRGSIEFWTQRCHPTPWGRSGGAMSLTSESIFLISGLLCPRPLKSRCPAWESRCMSTLSSRGAHRSGTWGAGAP